MMMMTTTTTTYDFLLRFLDMSQPSRGSIVQGSCCWAQMRTATFHQQLSQECRSAVTAAGHTNNGVLTHLNLVLPLSLNGNKHVGEKLRMKGLPWDRQPYCALAGRIWSVTSCLFN